MRKLVQQAAVLIVLLDVTQSAAGLLATYTPPRADIVQCQLAIGTYVIADNVLPGSAPCATNTAYDCATVPLKLGPGRYPFQLVCSTGELSRSAVVPVWIGQ